MTDVSVSVAIVTYNSARYIRRCLEALLAAHGSSLPIIVVDNESTDETLQILEGFGDRISVIANQCNVGFAAGQNQAIRQTVSRWVLVLNPDVLVSPEFILNLLQAGESDTRIGTVCGKLLAWHPDCLMPDRPILDSTGIYFTPELRHLDRGSKQVDSGQFNRAEYVFGATGAAALYRRAMVDDVALDGEFFDEDFFAYREDADLAWRAQLLGWRCLYTPNAIAHHVRTVLPANRRQVSSRVNFHSVKNRFLMRIKNMDAELYRRHWFAITRRDVLVLAGCLLREWTSLPAFWFVLRHWRSTWRKRRLIMGRRRAAPAVIAEWFAYTPAVQPASGPLPSSECASLS